MNDDVVVDARQDREQRGSLRALGRGCDASCLQQAHRHGGGMEARGAVTGRSLHVHGAYIDEGDARVKSLAVLLRAIFPRWCDMALKMARSNLAATTVVGGLLSALYISWKSRRAVENRPPTGHFLDVDGLRLHYVESGEGEPVVLLHGNAVSHADFLASGLFARLAATHRVIAFDRPGHGHSSRPSNGTCTPAEQARMVLSALEQLGVHQAVVVGHSMGTLVALHMAVLRASAVKHLVLMGGYFYPHRRVDVTLAAPLIWPYIGTGLLYTVTGLASRMLFKTMVKHMFSPRRVPPDFVPFVDKELMLRPSQLRASAEDAECLRPAALELCKHYAALQMPVTIVTGGMDRIVKPGAHSLRLHQELPHSALITDPTAGHMVHYSTGADIVARILEVERRPSASAMSPSLDPRSSQSSNWRSEVA